MKGKEQAGRVVKASKRWSRNSLPQAYTDSPKEKGSKKCRRKIKEKRQSWFLGKELCR